jgi:peptide/nickel transport system substrate-binding protein/oligopeptide transport system substrate-binding protein
VISLAALIGIVILRPGPFSSHSASPTRGAAPAAKQVVRIVEGGTNGGDLNAIDPALIEYGGDYDKAQLVFPPLVMLDDAGKPVDWAAQSHETSGDGLTYTFHLRPSMRWSDGVPIDANTFAYSINRALDPCFASPVASYLFNLKGAAAFNATPCRAGANGLSADTLVGTSIVVTDPLTLTLHLKQPAAYFLGAFSYPTSWAVPKQLIDRYGQTKWVDHLADGAGFGGNLYKVVQWDHKEVFTLAANEAFWGQKPILQKVEWSLFQSGDTAWLAYQAGDGDVGFPTGTNATSAKTQPGYAVTPTLSVSYLRVNWALAPFDDARVRNAFSLAIDRTAIAHAIYKDNAIPTIHMIIQGLPGYNPDLKNAAGDSGDKALRANVAQASELAKAYAAEKCAGDFSKCTPIVYSSPNDATRLLLAQVLQQEWQTAFPGWPITVQSIARSLELKTFAKLQIGWDGWGADYPDAQDFLTLLWARDAQYNQSSVDVPAADALMKQADVSSDATGRLRQYQQAEQLLVDQGAFIAYAQPLSAWVVHPSSKLEQWRINAQYVTSLATWQHAYIAA